VESLVAVHTEQPRTVLTFDDGPEPGGAEKVLAELSDYAQTATFFVLVYRALRYPELLAEVVAARR
jgi:peptidoglycan/xylan/chitin deacetylase (PgdA/CDA1 family)